MALRKILAFLYRDFLEQISYKIAFFFEIFGIFASVITFYFLSKLFGGRISPYLEPYGGDYFSFVLIGIAFSNYLGVSLMGLSNSVRSAQVTGTLEALLVTKTSLPFLLFASTVYSFLLTSLSVVVYVVVGVSLFGAKIVGGMNLLSALIILILTIISFTSLGMLSCSFILVFKRGNPFNWIFTTLSELLGGVFYPITILPIWLSKISILLPITHSLKAMRLILLKNYTLAGVSANIIYLTIFSAIMVPIGILSFRIATNKAKRDGTLTHF
ncbi:MAG: ABC transporter permease [bacterium]|nr:ABC transporter permease [bacterium]